MNVYFLTVLCVMGIAAGQVLFKLSANAMNRTGSFFALETLAVFFATMVLYGITSVGWVLILRRAELGKVYPFMALAFVIVPLASRYFFGERFAPSYFVGTALIMVGIVVTVSASR
jgi:drug/metabolite transporter (DMT)-like permease